MTRSIRWPRVIIVTLIAILGVAGFSSLGLWQVARLHWKSDLIARVDARVHADPVAAPGPADWAAITTETAEYTRVTLQGDFLNADEVQIYTPTEWGAGYWVLTPLVRDDGTTVFINRGIVPEAMRDPATRPAPAGPQTITGLLRLPEAKGWLFSRDNRPAEGQWFRRDIASIAAAKGLSNVAPYFVDQDLLGADALPRGGQTVVAFRNSHLSYAITWFALTAVVLVAWGIVLRHELRDQRD